MLAALTTQARTAPQAAGGRRRGAGSCTPAAALAPRAAAAPPPPLRQRAAGSSGFGARRSSSSPGSGRGRLVVTAAVKVQKGKQMLCSKTLKAKEGHEDQLRTLCQGVAEFSRERMSDRSSGVVEYTLSEDDYEKGTFHFMELYASQTAMVAHNERPEIEKFVDQVGEHLEGPLGMVLYEYANGKIGPAGMEGDVKGEGGLDDATGTNRFGGGASMKQTSAVVDLTSIKEEDDDEKGLWGIKFSLPDWVKGATKKKD